MQETVDLLKEFEEISGKFAEPMSDDEMNALLEKQGKVQDKLDATGAWDLDSRLDLAMDALRCPPGDTPVKVLSGGELRRVALCRLLLITPDILLLDEPTNHLDAESVAWLEQHLRQYEGTVIAVTHDRYFLDNVAGWILELDRGYGIPWKGNYSSWLAQKQERLQREEKAESDRQRTLAASSSGSACRQRDATPRGRPASAPTRASSAGAREAGAGTGDLHPARAAAGRRWSSGRRGRKGYGDRALLEEMTFTIPPGRWSESSGRTGRGRPRCSA